MASSCGSRTTASRWPSWPSPRSRNGEHLHHPRKAQQGQASTPRTWPPRTAHRMLRTAPSGRAEPLPGPGASPGPARNAGPTAPGGTGRPALYEVGRSERRLHRNLGRTNYESSDQGSTVRLMRMGDFCHWGGRFSTRDRCAATGRSVAPPPPTQAVDVYEGDISRHQSHVAYR